MKLKELIKNKWFRFFSNIYILVLTFFVVWMLFFDTNSWWFTHRELDKEIEKLKQQQIHLRREIEKDKALIEQLQDSETLEKFAREKYYYKRDNEEIYLIEMDSAQQKD